MPTSTIPPKAKPLPPGVYTPVVTLYKPPSPSDPSASQPVDLDAMRLHCRHLIAAGMHGLVYLGTNGELPLLTSAERHAIISMASETALALKGPSYPVVAGISAPSTHETILNARSAASAGASFALLLPPSYWPKSLSPDALLQYYRDVATSSPIPIVVYNFPAVTSGTDLDSDQIAALAEHPNIVAVKLTCGNLGKLTRLTSRFSPAQFGVFGGSSDYLLPTLRSGGSGCVTGLGNVFPASVARGVYDAWARSSENGGQEETASAREATKRAQDAVANSEWACKKGLAMTKYGAWHFVGKGLGLDEAAFEMRRPYGPLGDAQKRWALETLGVLEGIEKELS